MRPLAVALALLVIALPSVDAAQTKEVAIRGSIFEPTTIQIAAGDSIGWVNEDDLTHSIVSDNGSFRSGGLSRGGTYEHLFPAGGRYTYHCGVHPSMNGAIFVSAGGSSAATLAITTPAENASVSGTVRVQGTAPSATASAGASPSDVSVDVRVVPRDWAPALVTTAPDGTRSWTYDWDTRTFPNGGATLQARLTIGEEATLSSPRTVIVANGAVAMGETGSGSDRGGLAGVQLVVSPLRVNAVNPPSYIPVSMRVSNLGSDAVDVEADLYLNGSSAESAATHLAAKSSEEIEWRILIEVAGSWVLYGEARGEVELPEGTRTFGPFRTEEVIIEVVDGGGEGVEEPLPPIVALGALVIAAAAARLRRR